MKLKCSQTHLKCQYRELLNLRFFITHYTVFRHASTIDAEPQWLEASSWARPTSHCHPAWGSLSKVSRIPGRCPVFLKDQEREMVKQKIHDLHQHTSTATSVQQKPICGRPNRKKKTHSNLFVLFKSDLGYRRRFFSCPTFISPCPSRSFLQLQALQDHLNVALHPGWTEGGKREPR